MYDVILNEKSHWIVCACLNRWQQLQGSVAIASSELFFNSSPALANSRVIVGVDVTLATTLYKMVDVNGIHRAYLELIAVSTENFLLLG